MTYRITDADAATIGEALLQARELLDSSSRHSWGTDRGSPRANKARAALDQLLDSDEVVAFLESIDPALLPELE